MPFGDKVRVLTARPQPRVAPAHPFLPEDAPHLTARHLDAVLAGHCGERIERPFDLTLRIRYRQFAREFIGGLSGGWELDQIENRTALLVGEPGLATAPGFIPSPSKLRSLKAWSRSRTVWGWQPSTSAI